MNNDFEICKHQWISVKDKLPKNEDYILFLINYTKYEMTNNNNNEDLEEFKYAMIIQGYYDYDCSSYFYLCPHLSFHCEDEMFSALSIEIKSQTLEIPSEWITHWMPLPNLPLRKG